MPHQINLILAIDLDLFNLDWTPFHEKLIDGHVTYID